MRKYKNHAACCKRWNGLLIFFSKYRKGTSIHVSNLNQISDTVSKWKNYAFDKNFTNLNFQNREKKSFGWLRFSEWVRDFFRYKKRTLKNCIQFQLDIPFWNEKMMCSIKILRIKNFFKWKNKIVQLLENVEMRYWFFLRYNKGTLIHVLNFNQISYTVPKWKKLCDWKFHEYKFSELKKNDLAGCDSPNEHWIFLKIKCRYLNTCTKF